MIHLLLMLETLFLLYDVQSSQRIILLNDSVFFLFGLLYLAWFGFFSVDFGHHFQIGGTIVQNASEVNRNDMNEQMNYGKWSYHHDKIKSNIYIYGYHDDGYHDDGSLALWQLSVFTV